MSDGGEARTTAAAAGWYPDPMTPSRRRYWTGSSWTYATTDAVPVDHPAPEVVSPLPEGHRLPDPVAPQSTSPPAPASGEDRPRQRPVKWIAAIVVGLLVGLFGVFLSDLASSDRPSPSPLATDGTPGTTPSPSPSPTAPTGNNDPSTAALTSLVVKPEDVPSTVRVRLFPGGVGLSQPTLDLCNGRYPSESLRTARLQDAVVDAQGRVLLSTEAVLYGDSRGTTQAFSELQSVVAACPPAPVESPVGQPTAITTFHASPDSAWPQTPTVTRQAYDLTSEDASGEQRRTIAVYLQRGRALLAVYFSQHEDPQVEVQGQTTIEGIVGVFAGRLAALPTSVVGA